MTTYLQYQGLWEAQSWTCPHAPSQWGWLKQKNQNQIPGHENVQMRKWKRPHKANWPQRDACFLHKHTQSISRFTPDRICFAMPSFPLARYMHSIQKKMMVQMKGKSAQQLNNRRGAANRTAAAKKKYRSYIKSIVVICTRSCWHRQGHI